MATMIENTSAANTFASSVWKSHEETQARHPVIFDEFKQGAQGQDGIYQQVRELSSADEDDEDHVPPTEHAALRFYEIISATAYHMTMNLQSRMPDGNVLTDYDGGIRTEWWNGECCVTLVVGHNDDAKSYVFVKLSADDAGSVNERILTARLASQLKSLLKV